MENLEYVLGTLHMDLGKLRCVKDKPEDLHRFLIAKKDNVASVYIYMKECEEQDNKDLAKHLNIKGEIIGGGHVFLDKEELWLGGYSEQYGSIPKQEADRAAELLLIEFNRMLEGIEEVIEKIVTKPCEKKLNDFWKKQE